MAKNDLTPIQDVITREFLVEVATAENVLSNNPASKKRLIGLLYQLLNYQRLPDGRFVSRDTSVRYMLGGTVSDKEYPDEWSKDYARAIKALNEEDTHVKQERSVRAVQEDMFATDFEDSDEANSGKQTKNTPLWKTLFSKDV